MLGQFVGEAVILTGQDMQHAPAGPQRQPAHFEARTRLAGTGCPHQQDAPVGPDQLLEQFLRIGRVLLAG
ncbi:hypothetical protein [Streptomyces thermospinosisporus]|uniref:hypothetical protein n=1 Tax=Streptomyces thermospinosisporus TaxID=161482 RepID=UPI0031E04D74